MFNIKVITSTQDLLPGAYESFQAIPAETNIQAEIIPDDNLIKFATLNECFKEVISNLSNLWDREIDTDMLVYLKDTIITIDQKFYVLSVVAIKNINVPKCSLGTGGMFEITSDQCEDILAKKIKISTLDPCDRSSSINIATNYARS